MDARFFDVFHDAGDENVLAIAEGVDIHFGGVFEKTIDENGRFDGKIGGFLHVAAHGFFVISDHHVAAAEYVAGANEYRKTRRAATSQASATLVAVPCGGEGMCRSASSLPKSLRSSARSIVLGIGADDGQAEFFERHGQVQWCLTAELNDEAVGLFDIVDVENFFWRQRFEVEAVARVVIGRDCFRVAVDHDGLDAEFLQRERGVAAAVIELDSLPYAIGAAAENHDLLAIGGGGFVLGFVARIHVRREAFEFGGAGIDAIEDGFDA